MIELQEAVVRDKDLVLNNCLYWAIVSNNQDLFTFLLKKCADFKIVNRSKENLLHVACMLGHHKFIPILITQCKMPVTDLVSRTELHWRE